MLFEKSLEKIFDSEKFQQAIREAVKNALDENLPANQEQTEEFKRLLLELNTLDSLLKKERERSLELENQLSLEKRRNSEYKQESDKFSLEIKMLEKNVLHEKNLVQMAQAKIDEAEKRIEEYKLNSREAENCLPEQRRVFNSLSQNPILYTLITVDGKVIDFETFVMASSQLTTFTAFWKKIAYDIRKDKRPWSAFEQDLLQMLFRSYNLAQATVGKKAEWIFPEPGQDFDDDYHDKIGQSGMLVKELLLPGLISTTGKIALKALVFTE